MKKFLAIICSIVLSFCLVGCGEKESSMNYSQETSNYETVVQLEAPENVRYDNDILKWNIVDNASGYLVTIGSEEFSCPTNFLDLSNLNISNGTFAAKVRAIGGGQYTSSANSNTITISIEKTVDEEVSVQLNIPENFRCDNGILKWNIVDNASGYVVVIDEEEFSTFNNFFNVNDLNIPNGTYEVKVRAVGRGQYTSSTHSDVITITIEKNISVESGVQTEGGKNKFDITKTVSGYIADASGTVGANEWYVTSDFIPVTAGKNVAITGIINRFLAYDNNKNTIADSFSNSAQTDKVYMPTVDGFIRISVQTAFMDSVMVAYSDTCQAYEPVREVIENGVYLNESQIEEQVVPVTGNVLYGKKWVACGDSFTQGDFSNAPEGSENQFTDGLYKGQNKVYPFFIGRRNSMMIVNEAVSGSTLAKSNAGAGYFSAPNGRYTQIPKDADYITLWFGINDEHQGVPIGTIDDTTNETFYGAWNVVMEYLLVNHPKAKIGIVITNGCLNTAYPKATREIAQKWGVGYLDINGDYKVPLMLRVSEKPNVSDAVHQLILERQSVLYGVNGHPNAEAHEYQSTFIEAWLRTL